MNVCFSHIAGYWSQRFFLFLLSVSSSFWLTVGLMALRFPIRTLLELLVSPVMTHKTISVLFLLGPPVLLLFFKILCFIVVAETKMVSAIFSCLLFTNVLMRTLACIWFHSHYLAAGCKGWAEITSSSIFLCRQGCFFWRAGCHGLMSGFKAFSTNPKFHSYISIGAYVEPPLCIFKTERTSSHLWKYFLLSRTKNHCQIETAMKKKLSQQAALLDQSWSDENIGMQICSIFRDVSCIARHNGATLQWLSCLGKTKLVLKCLQIVPTLKQNALDPGRSKTFVLSVTSQKLLLAIR